MWDAMIRLIADGIPIGRSLVRSLGSLWRQNKYVSVKKARAILGMLPWYMRLKSCWMSLLMDVSLILTRDMKVSMESARMPVPLFFPDLRMVSQTFPWRWRSWLFFGGSGWWLVVLDVTGGGYRP